MLLASSGQRPGKLQNLLKCTGQIPAAKNCPTQNVRSEEVEKPWSRSFAGLGVEVGGLFNVTCFQGQITCMADPYICS